MSKYGTVAVNAVLSILSGNISDPLNAWKEASAKVFGEGTWAQRKGCPKNAFLGLCEAGLVKGIPAGDYVEISGARKNKGYAVNAIEVLKRRPELSEDKLGLWRMVMQGNNMSHNSQMDVVLALWNKQLINCE
ncbi:DUF6979 family protein [Paenibacillus algicola]|uniref:DUF6979 family protein n=1 Tax=Paenibacillus algicola TaxID=2565926 RepID=UPI0010FEEDF4|nr:hypothetical protein [Paenibacillus algicola]